ncbi:MAG TPA: serine hydrolase, partial [Cellulomonas sp.]
RDVVGHSGGYPGHITRTYIDPRARLVVSVLTNAIDGPADPIAVGLIKLIDLALKGAAATGEAPAPAPSDALPLSAYTGRFASLWGVTDLVELGGRLVLVRPTGPDPTAGYEELTVLGPDRLRIRRGPGFGPVGEQLVLDRAADGSIRSISAGMTSWPIEEFRRNRTSMTRLRGTAQDSLG